MFFFYVINNYGNALELIELDCLCSRKRFKLISLNFRDIFVFKLQIGQSI